MKQGYNFQLILTSDQTEQPKDILEAEFIFDAAN